MKKIISILVVVALMATLAVAVYAASPADFGWNTDGDDFAGWTAEDEANLSVSYNDSHNNHRVWKNLIADKANFDISVDVEAENGSRPIIKVMGIIVELNAEGGNGNQFFVKNYDGRNWNNFDWMNATACKANVRIVRENGGNLVITVTGADNATPIVMNVAPAEDNENVELSLYSGNVSFKNIIAGTQEPETPVEPAKTPADFGWFTDGDDFAGWTAEDEANLSVSYNDSHNNHRVWKNLIADKANFDISVDVAAENGSRPILKVMGIIVELNAEGGNGNQFFVKNYDGRNWNNFDWLNATACKANVRIVRMNGGNLIITITGVDNATPIIMNVAPAEDNENVELSLYSGNVSFKNITAVSQEPEAPVEPAKTPADFGWNTDSDDFAGWTAEDETNLSVSYNDSHNNHRVWKNLITDKANFDISVDVEAENGSRPILKVMGIIVELNAEGGNGNQFFVKNYDGRNWNNFDWLNATACKANVRIVRENGGNLVITVTGADNATPIIMNVAPAEDNENVELSLYSGNVSFKNITATTPACSHANVEIKNAVAATCTEAGFTGNTVCADCGEQITAGQEIPALGHVNTKVEGAVAATCEGTGFTGNTICVDCNATVVAGEEIPALGHNYVGNECTVCGNPKTGDMFGIVVAMMAASGTALVSLKKKEN